LLNSPTEVDISTTQTRSTHLRMWRVFRKWGQASTFLGIVPAHNPQAALEQAIKQFKITSPEHQKRVVVELRE